MIPGQHLELAALTRRVPVDVDRVLGGGEDRVSLLHPALVAEVLAPAVEAAAVTPHGLDDGADAAVAAAQQALDDAGLAVVVAHADARTELLVGSDGVLELLEPLVRGLGRQLTAPLERRVRLRHEPADGDGAADVLAAAHLAPGLDDAARHVGDLQDVLVGLGGQAAHEVQLHLTPARAVCGGNGVDEVVLGDHLVDDLADALAAALGRERQTRAAAVARQLVGEVDVERVDARRRQRQTRLRALVAVGEALGDLGDLGVVGGAQREQAHLLEAGRGEALLDHLADAGDRTLAHGARDHAGLAETATTRAAAEDLDAHPLVDGLGHRHERLLRVRPLVEIHDGVLRDAPRHTVRLLAQHDTLDAPVGQVVDLVHRRHVDAARAREFEQQPATPAGALGELPLLDDVGDEQDGLFAVTDDGGVDEVGDRLGVERRVPAREDDRVVDRALVGVQGDSAEVERRQHVRVAELGRERHAEHVEVAHAAVAVDGELRHARLTHLRLHVRPHGVGALGERVVTLVEHFVQDHDALVGHADLVGVGVHEGPARRQLLSVGAVAAAVPVLDLGVELATDVLDRLVHLLQQRLEIVEDRLTRHVHQGSSAQDERPIVAGAPAQALPVSPPRRDAATSAATNASTSSSRVSNEHIQRTSPRASSQS